MYQVFQVVFPIFAIVLLGYLHARRHGPDMASANRLNLEIFTPALIFSVLSGEGFELARYADLAFAAMAVVLGSGLLAAAAALQWWSLPAPQAAQLAMFAALPPAVLNFMLAERYGIAPRQVAAIVLLGNLASLLLIPAVLYALI